MPGTRCFLPLKTPPVSGQEVVDTGAPIKMPIGPETLGRILNVIGKSIDERGRSTRR